ncbi:peptide ABC transporter substrate-binding protein, partial [Phyllobacterium salinisoli]
AASVRRFEAKEMDLVYNFSADQIPRLRNAYGDSVHISPSLSTEYYAFDTRAEPYNDVRVRRALSMVIDRDFLAKVIYSGSQLPAHSMVPPGIESYGEPFGADFADMSQLDCLDVAIELMKEAGYGEGGNPLNIEIRYNTNPNHERVATAVADMWKNAFGAKVSLLNLDVASHFAYLQEDGKFNVARAGWVAEYSDAESFLALSVSGNKTFNYGKFNNPRYDALMKQSYTERDPAARSIILHEAEKILMKEQPIAPLLTQAYLWLVSDKVQGWQDNAPNQHLSKFLSVAE